MRKYLKKAVFVLAYYLGIIRIFYHFNKKQRILVFHHVIPDKYINDSLEQHLVCISQTKFEMMLKIINRKFPVTTELGKNNTVVITFDDGYRAALVAKESLSKFANKAYFFIPVDNIEGGPLWIDEVMAWFAYVPEGKYIINDDWYLLNDYHSRLVAFNRTKEMLYITYEKEKYLSQLNGQYAFSSLPIERKYYELRFLGLTHYQLMEMKEEGHKIGPHSLKHDILSCLSIDELKTDFSKTMNCADYNTKVYAYPFGHNCDVSQDAIRICEEVGFDKAVMNEFVKKETSFTLSRINISHYDSRFEIEAALSGFTQWMKKLSSNF